jgi:hypothetical protein
MARPPSPSVWRRLTRGFTPAILIPVFLAFISFVYTALDYSRKERLESVRAQVVNLYGPLAALTDTSEQLWHAVGRNSRPKTEEDLNDDKKLKTWRNFLSKVVLPLSDKIQDILLNGGQIIHCQEVAKELHQFFSFAAFIKLATVTWESEGTDTDRTMIGNGIDHDHAYPRTLSTLLAANRDELKARERKLDNPIIGLFYFPNLDPPCPDLNSAATKVATRVGR